MSGAVCATVAEIRVPARRLSSAQRRALIGLRDHGNAAYGIRGRSARGGFCLTELWLWRNHLYRRLDLGPVLTERGFRVLEADRLVP